MAPGGGAGGGARDGARDGARGGARSPAAGPVNEPARSTLDVIYESLFGDIYTKESMASWTPLTLGGFFTGEGWDQAYLFPPSGDGGKVPRHGWLQGLAGTFFRAWFFAFVTAQDAGHNGNLYVGQYTLFAPLNRHFSSNSITISSSRTRAERVTRTTVTLATRPSTGGSSFPKARISASCSNWVSACPPATR